MAFDLISAINRTIKNLSPMIEAITRPTGHADYSNGSAYVTDGVGIIDSLMFSRPDICANPYLLMEFENRYSFDQYGIRDNELVEKYIERSGGERSNRETISYFKLRGRKKKAKALINFATIPVSKLTAGVHVPKLSLSLSSTFTSGVHHKKIKDLSDSIDKSDGYSYYDDKTTDALKKNVIYLIKIKRNKTVSTLINTALLAIPGGVISGNYKEIVYALNITKNLFDELTSKGNHVDGINNEVIMRVAMAIHFLANQDLRTSLRIHTPAARVFEEVFAQRGISIIQGIYKKYDVVALIKEPAGWLALADKLSL